MFALDHRTSQASAATTSAWVPVSSVGRITGARGNGSQGTLGQPAGVRRLAVGLKRRCPYGRQVDAACHRVPDVPLGGRV
jgi:hypothetical protein